MKLILALFTVVVSAACLRGQGLQAERSALEALVNDWKEFQNSRDLDALMSLYAPQVLFYGERRTPAQLIIEKARQLEAKHDYILSIKSDIHFTTFQDSIVKCSFIRGVYYKHTLREYPSYLVAKKIGKTYKIIGESDKYTDKNLNVKAEWGPEVPLDQFLADNSPAEKSTGQARYLWLYLLSGAVLVVGSWLVFRRGRSKKLNAEQT